MSITFSDTKAKKLGDIEFGDHIFFKCCNPIGVGVYHHDIVIDITRRGNLVVIGRFDPEILKQTYGTKEGCDGLEVTVGDNVSKEPIYIRKYHKTLFDIDSICQQAEEMFKGQKGGPYDLEKNNCEHFASFCCTGIKYSQQVKDHPYLCAGCNMSTEAKIAFALACSSSVGASSFASAASLGFTSAVGLSAGSCVSASASSAVGLSLVAYNTSQSKEKKH